MDTPSNICFAVHKGYQFVHDEKLVLEVQLNVKMSRVSRFLTQIIRQSLAISLAVLSNKRDACKKILQASSGLHSVLRDPQKRPSLKFRPDIYLSVLQFQIIVPRHLKNCRLQMSFQGIRTVLVYPPVVSLGRGKGK